MVIDRIALHCIAWLCSHLEEHERNGGIVVRGGYPSFVAHLVCETTKLANPPPESSKTGLGGDAKRTKLEGEATIATGGGGGGGGNDGREKPKRVVRVVLGTQSPSKRQAVEQVRVVTPSCCENASGLFLLPDVAGIVWCLYVFMDFTSTHARSLL